MKPISFEGLRRLVRGHRDKESDSSQTFKRSNSFKRATFRKSLHKHDKVTLPNGLVVKTSAVQRKESVSSSEERKDDGYSTDGGDGAGGSGSSTDPKAVISYDQWVANSKDDYYMKGSQADESCPSTLSTNKLSSLDSGVRHSMDSKKKCTIDSNKRLSLDHRRVIGLETVISRPDLSRCPATPRRSLEKNFHRSVSTDSPVPPTRLKSLLGSPRIAPKHRDHSPSTAVGISAYSVHSTPNRNRVLSQPMSAPSTPGKQIQRVLQHQRPSHTPTHQPPRSTLHDKEKFCAVHGSPALQRVQHVERHNKSVTSITSPKPQNRWSAVFNNSIFSRSPARKGESLKNSVNCQSSTENISQHITNQNTQSPLYWDKQQINKSQYYQVGCESPVLRQRSVHSTHNSPALLRSRVINNHPAISTSSIPSGSSVLDARLGIARAMGGPRPPEETSAKAFNSESEYHSPHVLQRNYSQPCTNSSPVIHRQTSAPTPDLTASAFRSRPISSPPPALSPANHTFHPINEQSVVNTSQFYPGKLVHASLVSGLPSVSVVGGRSLSSDRCGSRSDSHERATPHRTLSAERPRTPSLQSRLSVPSWGRPFSLALGCAKGKADLLSPASMTSDTSARSDRRRRGPSLLVGKASWFSRNTSARRSFRLNKNKKMEVVEFTEESEDPDNDVPPPPPPRPARLMAPEEYKKLRDQSQFLNASEPVFVPPHKRRPTSPVKFPMSLWRKNNNPEIRGTHADILMPLSSNRHSEGERENSVFGSSFSNDHDEIRDTNSEPGGAKFSVAPKNKPKSVPNTTRLNIKLTKNPEGFLKALGIDTKKGRKKSQSSKNDSIGEQIITQLLLEQLTSANKQYSSSEHCPQMLKPNLPINTIYEVNGDLESPAESLSSLVSSVISSRASNSSRSKRKTRKVRRKKSHKRVPSLPTYPSWKKTQKGVGATAAAARDENGRCSGL